MQLLTPPATHGTAYAPRSGASLRYAPIPGFHRSDVRRGGMIRIVTNYCGPSVRPLSSPRSISSQVQQEPLRVLQALLHAHQEGHGILAVDDAVVIAQGEAHHRAG